MALPYSNEDILAARSLAKGREMIKANLAASDKWVCKAILAIYARQTADEQASDTTDHHNGVGFSAADAEILSSFAKQIQRHEAGHGRYLTPLSPRQLELGRRRISKYAGQLLQAAHARAQAEYAAAREERDRQQPEFDEWKAEMIANGIEAT